MYTGDHRKLRSWLFQVNQFCEFNEISVSAEKVKYAVSVLSDAALTWWESVAAENWARIGTLTWEELGMKMREVFRDDNHEMRKRQELDNLRQKTSVA